MFEDEDDPRTSERRLQPEVPAEGDLADLPAVEPMAGLTGGQVNDLTSQPLAGLTGGQWAVPTAHAAGGRRLGWRSRAKVVGVGASVAVVALVAVIVPMQLGRAASISGAVGNVFAHQTAQFTITESGTKALRGYALQLTLSNADGGLVSAPGAKNDCLVSVLHDGTDLGDLLVSHEVIALRLDTPAIDQLLASGHAGGNVGQSGSTSLTGELEEAAQAHPDLAYLHTLATGGWIAVRTKDVQHYIERALKRAESTSPASAGTNPISSLDGKSAAVRSAFELSFADAWDAVASLRVVSSSAGTTEYSVALPVAKFVSTFAQRLSSRLETVVPSLSRELKAVTRLTDSISPKLRLPIDLWVANGSLSKLAVSYKGQTITVGVDHPAPLTTPPGVQFVTIPDLKSFVKYEINLTASPRSMNASAATVTAALAFASAVYGVNNRTFTGLANESLPSNAPMSWAVDQPSTKPRVVSLRVGGGGHFVVLASYSAATRTCTGVVDIRSAQAQKVLAVSRLPGTYFFVVRHVPTADCNAATLTKVSAWSRSGVPGLGSGGSSASSGPLTSIFGAGGVTSGFSPGSTRSLGAGGGSSSYSISGGVTGIQSVPVTPGSVTYSGGSNSGQ